MPHSVREITAASAAVILALAAIPLGAQAGAGLLEGTTAFGDGHAGNPGTRRSIGPQQLPAPNTAESARNSVWVMRRSNAHEAIVPNGLEVNQFASDPVEPSRFACRR